MRSSLHLHPLSRPLLCIGNPQRLKVSLTYTVVAITHTKVALIHGHDHPDRSEGHRHHVPWIKSKDDEKDALQDSRREEQEHLHAVRDFPENLQKVKRSNY